MNFSHCCLGNQQWTTQGLLNSILLFSIRKIILVVMHISPLLSLLRYLRSLPCQQRTVQSLLNSTLVFLIKKNSFAVVHISLLSAPVRMRFSYPICHCGPGSSRGGYYHNVYCIESLFNFSHPFEADRSSFSSMDRSRRGLVCSVSTY